MIQIAISETFGGELTPTALLNNEGSLSAQINRQFITSDGEFFNVQSPNFVFRLFIQDEVVVFQRNDVRATLELSKATIVGEFFDLKLIWNYTRIGIGFGNGHKVTATGEPISPPNDVLSWAREQTLLPNIEYETTAKFNERVFDALERIQKSIQRSGSYASFWDVERDGNTILSRTPKLEPHVQPFFHCMLSDTLLNAGIGIVPEYPTGLGNVDFLFLGMVKDEGLVRCAVEFKNAHSIDLERGLEIQLPMYMESSNSQAGGYCILNYSGDWFDEPNDNYTELMNRLYELVHNSGNPQLQRIKLLHFSLAKPKTASRR